ncbi:MAG: ABC transporter permease, partial [Deltaproteobacteria bacterium]|nr:ABC transporter permease [Deltaproteobacteria bacterium]
MPIRVLVIRFGVFAVTLLGAASLVLALLWAAPGDPIDLIPNGEELRPVLEEQWQLDRPIPVRLLHYLGNAVRGDLGTSLTYRPGMPVMTVIAAPTLRSLGWLLTALALTLVWGTALAWGTAGRRSLNRRLIQAVSIAPVFLIAHLSVNLINEVTLSLVDGGWMARPAWFALPGQPSAFRSALAVVVLAVGSGALTEVRAEVENALVEIRSSGYVAAARARAEPLWRHVFLNLVGPLTTIAATRAAFFVGGLVILEKVLLLNGIGSILWQAALLR